MNFGSFKCNGIEYTQHSGLALGSPLSPTAVRLYMEWLVKYHFKEIMGREVIWLHYVDDVLVVVRKR